MNHPPLPEGAVLLGYGGAFAIPESGKFKGWSMSLFTGERKWVEGTFYGLEPDALYAAPADSDVVRLNEIQYSGFDPCDSCENDLVCSDTGKCRKPAKQGETHPALTTLEEMANMPGAGNDMDLWNRHSCAVLKMAAELAEARAAKEWRTIETAPKDNLMWMLLYESPPEDCADIPTVGRWCSRHHQWVDDLGKKIEPTHWQPLPEAPNDQILP